MFRIRKAARHAKIRGIREIFVRVCCVYNKLVSKFVNYGERRLKSRLKSRLSRWQIFSARRLQRFKQIYILKLSQKVYFGASDFNSIVYAYKLETLGVALKWKKSCKLRPVVLTAFR